jgi:short-subunit dehydrogenase
MARKRILITGASAGIGAAFARAYAERGFDLVLTARRNDRLAELAGILKQSFGTSCQTIAVDLADPAGPQAILAQAGVVDGLVNNAGYGLPGTFANTSWADQAAFIQVMMTAPAELCHRALPGMISRGHGRIINVASLAGILPPGPGHTLYGASKAFLIKLSQSLNAECAGTGVQVSALCPGFTYSEFHDVNGTRGAVSKMPKWMWQTADAVVAEGIAGVDANRPVVVSGFANRRLAWLSKALPDGMSRAIVAGQSKNFRRME